MATSIATLDGGRTSIDDGLLEQLGTTMRGDVLKPGDLQRNHLHEFHRTGG